MTEAVRPASPDSGVGRVFKGRGVDQEGKRRFHQGPQDTGNLLPEAGYMTASVPRRCTNDFSLTSAAGPYMANSIRADAVGELRTAEICVSSMPSLKAKKLEKLTQAKAVLER